MSGYLLDTQTIRYWSDGQSGRFPVVQRAAEERRSKGPLYVSAITLGEFEYGHSAHPAGDGIARDEFTKFLRGELPQVLSISKHTAAPYGRIRAKLVEKFPPPGGWSNKKRAEQLYDPIAALDFGFDENDLWLVAQAIERNLVLVTNDRMTRIKEAVREIQPSFAFENWTTA